MVRTPHRAEIHSNVSSEDMKFQNLIEEVFKLLPADRFPKKTDDVLGGNRPRSSIEMEMMKAPKKSISLPQSKCPLIKTIDCIKQSLGAVEVDGSYPMPPTIAQDWLPSRADINKLVKLKYYQAHNEFIPTGNASVLDPDANCLDLSLSGVLILSRCHHFGILGVRTGLMVRASDSGSGDPGSILGRVGVFVSLSKRHLLPKSTGNTQE